MLERLTTTQLPTPVDTLPPSVAVVIVNSRGDHRPEWLVQARGSVEAQSHPNTCMVEVENNDHALSIGEAWNLAVRNTEADRFFFLGDDDFLAGDAIAHHSFTFDRLLAGAGPDVVRVTCGCTMVDERGAVLGMYAQHHTGMWLREHLLKEPFKEDLAKWVDVEASNRLKLQAQLSGRHREYPSGYYYGYYYRQHVGNVSGSKVQRQTMQAVR